MFKSVAVSVTKASTTSANQAIPIAIPEQQSAAAASSVEAFKHNAVSVQNKAPLQRRLPYWLGSTAESISVLIDISTHILPTLITDKEMHAGILALCGIAEEMSNRLAPSVLRYGSGNASDEN
jgi:hypothetical protein